MANKDENKDTVEKQARLRSRLYPRYDLEESIKFIQSINKLGGNRVSNQAVAAEVKKAVTNSGFTGRVSSSKQFGLLNQETGKLSVTTLAKEILIPRGDQEKADAIKTALATPELYRDLVKDFSGKTLPDQSALANRLFHDYRIEAVAKDSAARNFLRSVQFAGGLRNGILVVSPGEAASVFDDVQEENPDPTFTPPPAPNKQPPAVQGALFQDSGTGWSVTIKSAKPLNSETKLKLIEAAELLEKINGQSP